MPWISTRTSARVRRPVYRCWNRIVPKSGRCRLEALDVVFTSNFLEHLPHKDAIRRTLLEVYRCLKPGGRFIAMGPNIKYVPGEYWDFFDHYVPLTELSLAEGLSNCGFGIERKVGRFLPY